MVVLFFVKEVIFPKRTFFSFFLEVKNECPNFALEFGKDECCPIALNDISHCHPISCVRQQLV